MADRSRSPRRHPEAPEAPLLIFDERLQRLDVAALRTAERVPVGALADWRDGDAELRDDARFRLADKARFRDRLLERHATPRCLRIVFHEDTHEYFVDGVRAPWSGTTFSHACEVPFDDGQADRCARAPGWCERNGHVHADGSPFTADEVRRSWKDNGTTQSRRGTLLHWHIECHLNGYEIEAPHSPEFGLYLRFEREFLVPLRLAPWRTEMNLFHCGLRLAGQADLVCTDAAGDLVILDWKRSKKIEERGYRGQAQRPPLQHLQNCNLHLYYLQLNTYRHILETEYGRRVSGMYMVVLHPSQQEPRVYVVPRMEREIEALVAHLSQQRGLSFEPRPGDDAPFEAAGLDFRH